MSSRRWVSLTACENIPPREGRSAVFAGRELAIFNLGDRFLAVDGRCPHKSGPLCDGIVTGASVVCPLHAWKINLTTGVVERPTGSTDCVRTYATRVDRGILFVEVDQQQAALRLDESPADSRSMAPEPSASMQPPSAPA